MVGRLAGAFRNIGRSQIADAIISTMDAAVYAVRETDPFDTQLDLTLPRRDSKRFVQLKKVSRQS